MYLRTYVYVCVCVCVCVCVYLDLVCAVTVWCHACTARLVLSAVLYTRRDTQYAAHILSESVGVTAAFGQKSLLRSNMYMHEIPCFSTLRLPSPQNDWVLQPWERYVQRAGRQRVHAGTTGVPMFPRRAGHLG